jgi:hypothetical protein
MIDLKRNNGIKNITENKKNSKNGFYLAIGIAVGVGIGSSIDGIIANKNKKRQ